MSRCTQASPSLSGPDLNPIEMLWQDFKRAVHAQKPSSVAELQQLYNERVGQPHRWKLSCNTAGFEFIGFMTSQKPKHLHTSNYTRLAPRICFEGIRTVFCLDWFLLFE